MDSSIVESNSDLLVEGISKFLWYIEDHKNREACLPPIEIVPWKYIHLHGDIDDVPEDLFLTRILEFVHKLVNGDQEARKLFVRQLVQVREAHAYIGDFSAVLFPQQCQN